MEEASDASRGVSSQLIEVSVAAFPLSLAVPQPLAVPLQTVVVPVVVVAAVHIAPLPPSRAAVAALLLSVHLAPLPFLMMVVDLAAMTQAAKSALRRPLVHVGAAAA
eukprot:Trichotokara_eunicae@DN4055_c0_g1_i1.p3